jgi:16S rRNA (cytosine1402-N4)-methyltransferase
MLNPKGRAVVITFHSLEDRICKTVFKERSTVDIPKGVPIVGIEAPYELITKKPIVANEEELEENNRAHSAKMRIIEKK